jgi:F1F0 ATPase subunit 2
MNIVFACAVGVLIGIFFYGGLWFTVRALATTRWPVLLAIGSFWIRTLISVLAFYVVMGRDWRNALAWLVGFALGRVIVSLVLPDAGGRPQCT